MLKFVIHLVVLKLYYTEIRPQSGWTGRKKQTQNHE